jgi:hypothetical protein
MADQSDVERAIVGAIDAVLYPNGQSGTPPLTVVGAPARIYRGWPNGDVLDADLRAGVFNVSVVPRNGSERNTTRYPQRTQLAGALPAATYTLSQSGQTITVGGAAPSPYSQQNLVAFVNGTPVLVSATAGQTPAQLASALQAAIAAQVSGTSVSGAVITLPGWARIGALRVGVTVPTFTEVKRQEKEFQIAFWCPTPDLRDAASSAVDAALSGTPWLAADDGMAIRLIYRSSTIDDAPEKELLFRRDLIYLAEYPTIETGLAAQIVAEQANVDDAATGDVLLTSYS